MRRIGFSKKADKQLSKMNKPIARNILAWLRKNLNDCENPRYIGKPLKGDLDGYWRYRVGDYRIICEIHDDELLVLAIDVGHRKNI